ncbi:MAG: WbqC family protein, partial [Muribaculaceae bacterium]|nr:WbqC family protein [Muribaculaceae bacterium]
VRPQPVELWMPEPYWQVRADRLGFIPNLSILDLIFNLGPETALLWR